MIIKKLVLHNFGVYASTNVFEFKGNKPIVLIGGMNGRGKTTFLEAVLLALYGSNSFAYNESNYKSYGQYLKSFVNVSDKTLETYIDLEFSMDNKDNEKYCIHREWIGDKKRTTEKIQVYKDDSYNQFLTDNWSMFIENILPSGLSNFFFFDGEKIAELAVEKTSNQMKESIKTLLGISVLELLKSDLGRIINRTVKNQVGNAEAEEVESLRHQKEIAEINLVAVDEELEKLEETRNILEQKLDVKNQEYIAKGGDIVTQRQELYQKRTALMSKIDNYKEQLVLDAAAELPFLLVKDYLRNIRENSEIEQEQKMMEIALKKMNHFSKDYEKNNEQDSAAILRFMSYINKNSITKSHSISYNMSDSSLFKLQVLLDEQLLATKLNVIERQNKLKNIKNWNILCRWAFCFSLHENTVPTDVPINSDSNVEMSWYTFAGEYSEIYDALIKEWCIDKGIETTEENLAKYFKLHLERGISYLTGTNFIKNLNDLLNLAIEA